MKKTQRGFTLIELVLVIAIIGILAAIAVPKYVDLTGKAFTAAKAGMSGAVKSALAVAIADKDGVSPTVTELANYIAGGSPTATAGGIVVTIKNSQVTVPTYVDSACTTTTTAVGNQVACVGDAA